MPFSEKMKIMQFNYESTAKKCAFLNEVNNLIIIMIHLHHFVPILRTKSGKHNPSV